MNDRVLNLDELFGNSRPVVIVWKEKRFEFTLPDGMSLAQNNEWMKLQMRITNIQNKVSDIADQDIEELEDLVGKILEILSPAYLAENPPFAHRVRALEFYAQEVFPDLDKKVGDKSSARKNSTGA